MHITQYVNGIAREASLPVICIPGLFYTKIDVSLLVRCVHFNFLFMTVSVIHLISHSFSISMML